MAATTEKIQSGIQKYQYLRHRLYEVDVSTDRDFQKAFNGFFRMGRRNQEYYTDFFQYLQQHKAEGISFSDALTFLYAKHGRLEISFVSKMVAIVDPAKPIWDSTVTLGHFGIKAPYPNAKNRLEKGIERYELYCREYRAYMQTAAGKQKLALFNRHFPNTDISDVKKVDFILWQER